MTDWAEEPPAQSYGAVPGGMGMAAWTTYIIE